MINRVSRLSPLLTLARDVLREAMRNRLFTMLGLGLGAVIALCEFTGGMTLTETAETQAGMAAFILRLGAVFLICLLTVAGTAREFHDRNLDVLLALPFPRYVYYTGKLCGYLLTAIIIAALAGFPLFIYAEAGRVAVWCASLFCELAMMAALCLFFMNAGIHIAVPFSMAAACYLLARTIGSMQLISHSPLLEDNTWTQEAARVLLDLVALILPRLDAFTRTEWLLYDGSGAQLAPLVGQTVICIGMLAAAGLYDLYRRNF